jgi:hypothetical protein
VHASAFDRIRRQRARPEEARGPEPLIDAHQPSATTSVIALTVPADGQAYCIWLKWCQATRLRLFPYVAPVKAGYVADSPEKFASGPSVGRGPRPELLRIMPALGAG